jgi:GNAT superfamily N-acetyltransferase
LYTPDAQPVHTYTIRLARPDEDASCTTLEDDVWAAFHGAPDGSLFIGYDPALHVVALDPDGRIVATGDAVGFDWDGNPEHLPARGWQQVIRAAAHGFPVKPAYACALGITVAADARGHGLGSRMVHALKQAALDAGYGALAAPVRPTEKWRMPELGAAAYAQIRLSDGRLFDPWLRIHEQAGGQQIGVCEHSLDIAAPRVDWQRWTGLRLPENGQLLIDGAVGYLTLRDGQGTLAEPSVWYLHNA